MAGYAPRGTPEKAGFPVDRTSPPKRTLSFPTPSFNSIFKGCIIRLFNVRLPEFKDHRHEKGRDFGLDEADHRRLWVMSTAIIMEARAAEPVLQEGDRNSFTTQGEIQNI